MKIIRKSALMLVRDRKLLVTRTRGKHIFLSPGGKPEGNETAEQALSREIKEELGCEIDSETLKLHGRYEDVAANDPDTMIHLTLFRGDVIGNPKPCGEIEEICWVDSSFDQSMLASIIRKNMIPELLESGEID